MGTVSVRRIAALIGCLECNKTLSNPLFWNVLANPLLLSLVAYKTILLKEIMNYSARSRGGGRSVAGEERERFAAAPQYRSCCAKLTLQPKRSCLRDWEPSLMLKLLLDCPRPFLFIVIIFRPLPPSRDLHLNLTSRVMHGHNKNGHLRQHNWMTMMIRTEPWSRNVN